MPHSNITALLRSRRSTRARSGTVAAPEFARTLLAGAGHGGPAGTSRTSGFIAAEEPFRLQLRTAVIALKYNAKNAVATLASARLAAAHHSAAAFFKALQRSFKTFGPVHICQAGTIMRTVFPSRNASLQHLRSPPHGA